MSILFLNLTFGLSLETLFPLSPAKFIRDYFDIKRCGSNNTFLLQRVILFANKIFGARKETRPEQKKNPRVP
jgi:hypothetical protein